MAGNRMQKATKVDLISAVSEHTGMNKADVRMVFDSLFLEVQKNLMMGKTVVLTGFGNFEVRLHKGHPAYYSQDPSGTKMLNDYRTVRFTPSKKFIHEIRDFYGDDPEAIADFVSRSIAEMSRRIIDDTGEDGGKEG